MNWITEFTAVLNSCLQIQFALFQFNSYFFSLLRTSYMIKFAVANDHNRQCILSQTLVKMNSGRGLSVQTESTYTHLNDAYTIFFPVCVIIMSTG